MKTFQFGPFVMKAEIAIMLLSIIFVFFIMKYLLKNNRDFQEKFLDTLFNSILIFVLIFKFSFAIFNFQSFLQFPVSVLYYTGGTKGIILGATVSLIYFIRTTFREHWRMSLVFINIIYAMLLYFTSYWLLRTIYILIFT